MRQPTEQGCIDNGEEGLLAGGAIAKYYAMCEWFDETCGQLLDYLDVQGVRDNTLVVYVTDNGWIQNLDNAIQRELAAIL